MSNVLPKDRAGDVQPWPFPEMDEATANRAGVPPLPSSSRYRPATLTLEQIEAIESQARDEGREAGYRDGQKEGRKRGYEEGFTLGRNEGFAQGHGEGLAQGATEVQQQAQTLYTLINALQQPLAALDPQVEQALVELATAVARQVMQVELQTQPQLVAHVVRQACQAVSPQQRPVRIYLHPRDREAVTKALNGDAQGWQWYDDPTITQGGCRVETEDSLVDATFESRLAAAMQQVRGAPHGDDDGEMADESA